MTVEQDHRPTGPALLDVEAAAIGCGDGVNPIGREREAGVGVRIGSAIERRQDPALVDHDPGRDTGKHRRHDDPPAPSPQPACASPMRRDGHGPDRVSPGANRTR